MKNQIRLFPLFSLLPVLFLLGLPSLAPAQTAIQIFAQSDGDLTEEERENMLENIGQGGIAIAPGNSFSFGGGSIGSVNPNNRSQLFQLLTNESVQKELELTEGQLEGAEKILEASRKRMSELVREQLAQNGGGGVIRLQGGAFSELMEKNQAEAEAALEEILLPKQLERIKQLAYQVDVAQDGIGEALANGRLGEEIGVYDQQREELLSKAAEIDVELQAAIVKIHAAARAKMFKELTPEQRKKAEELLGEYFHYQEISLNQQIRRSMRQMREAQPAEE